MSRSMNAFPAVAASLLLLASTAAASDDLGWVDDVEEPSGVAMVADVLVARPLGLVVTVVGTVFFVAGLPFAAMAGDIDTPAQLLIGEPARYTFVRPLGEIGGDPPDPDAPKEATW
ncbi:MAG: multidrug transporter [Candidatus Binatia bacterium]